MRILSILAMVGGVLCSLSLLLLCVVGMANATPQIDAQIKRFMIAIALVGTLSLAISIWLNSQNRHWLAIACALLPPIITGIAVFQLSEP